MRIEIEEKSHAKVAKVLKATMDANGGAWIVNCVGGEGFVVARVGSDAGKRLARSGAAGLCGPFDASWTVALIQSRLTDSLAAYRKAYGEDIELSPEVVTYVPPLEKVREVFLSGEVFTMDDVKKLIGYGQSTVSNALATLHRTGDIVMVQPSRGGYRPQRAAYRMAA